jgi:hypothetical protein
MSLTNYFETTLTKLWEQQESGDARISITPLRAAEGEAECRADLP